MTNPKPFPWHYFIRTVRARIILVILSSISTFIICNIYSEFLFGKVLLVILTFVIISFIQGYLRILPFRSTLSKIDEIQVQLPHNKKLNIIYQKNEWVLIQEMLKLAEKYIREQNQQILNREQQSNTVIQSIADPLVIVDGHLNCKQYNEEFKKSFIKNQNIQILESEKLWKVFDNDELIEFFNKSQKNHEPNRLHGYAINNCYYNISITPIVDPHSKNLGSLILFHNVTESILTEKMRVDFVANVSHEIRTPLTSIKGFSQLLLAQKDKCPESTHKPLERILYNTERLKDMFDNLLKLSVIESKYEIEKDYFTLREMVTLIQNNLKQKYKSTNFSIEINSDEEIFGDKKLLEQVFTNLIDNSIKYNPKEQKNIIINTTTHAHNQFITIQDNGRGIPEAELKRIFERFYRTQGQSTQIIEGTGLGLSIVKHIINKHNGIISVESKLDEGTTFKIQLPCE